MLCLGEKKQRRKTVAHHVREPSTARTNCQLAIGGGIMQFLPGEFIDVRWAPFILVAMPATMLAASLAGLPERSLRRGLKASVLILFSWIFFIVLDFRTTNSLETNSVLSLFILIADLFVRTSILEMTYKATFKRALAAAVIFTLLYVALGVLVSMIFGVGVGFLVLSIFFGMLFGGFH